MTYHLFPRSSYILFYLYLPLLFLSLVPPSPLTHPSVGRDEAGDADESCVGEQAGHLGYTPDVLLAVLRAEAQVLV